MQTLKSGQSEFTQPYMKYVPAGDSALIAKAGNDISEITNRRIQNMLREIESKQIQGIVELVPAFNELMIFSIAELQTIKFLSIN
jgi:allophanate hydrolase subunit 1